MIQKKQHPYINKRRTIQLFGVDFNSALKYVFGRKLLYTSKDQDINSTQTHSSMSGLTTHDILNIGKLTYDLGHLERLTMITCFNDAAGFYDQMRYNLTTITTRRIGFAKEFTLCYARVQNQMKYFIKAKVGVSKEFCKL